MSASTGASAPMWQDVSADATTDDGMKARRTAAELLATPGAFIDRPALERLGLQRRTCDFVFRELDVVAFPGVRRTYVRSDDVRRLLDQYTYAKDRVRPT